MLLSFSCAAYPFSLSLYVYHSLFLSFGLYLLYDASHITCGREFRFYSKREIKQEIVQLSTHMTEHKGQRNILSNGFIVFIYGFATVIMVDVSHMFCAICFATPFHSHSISMVFLGIYIMDGPPHMVMPFNGVITW
eukprot:453766_1